MTTRIAPSLTLHQPLSVPGNTTLFAHNSPTLIGRIQRILRSIKERLQNPFTKEECPHCLQGRAAVLRKDDLLMEVVDQRSTVRKVINCTQAIFRQIPMLLKRKARKRSAQEGFPSLTEEGRYPTESLPWKGKESEGLYLFIHGLRGHPIDWKLYQEAALERDPEATIFMPHVHTKGNVPLEDAAEPILEAVRDYLEEHPGKPIRIFGTSNGSRIATYIENALLPEELGDAPLRVVSISGVLKGTKFIQFLEKLRLIRFSGLNPTLQEEFRWESEVAQKTLNDWQEKQHVWAERGQDVRHFYCTSLEDEKVRPLKSALPYSNATITTHKIYQGHTHITVVDAACRDAFDWLDNHRKN